MLLSLRSLLFDADDDDDDDEEEEEAFGFEATSIAMAAKAVMKRKGVAIEEKFYQLLRKEYIYGMVTIFSIPCMIPVWV